MNNLTLYRIDPARNMRRFYHLEIQPDLFGNACLVREWGRIGRSGQTRIISYPNENEAQHALHRQCETKVKRGYAA